MPAEPTALWPAELDAMIAAPDYHDVMLENESVRVIRTRIAPGQRTPVHTHQWSGVLHIISWSHFVRYDDIGVVLLDSRTVESLKVPPQILWAAPLPPHYVENVGGQELNIISVELKNAAT
jgi:hypothetical protein